MMTTFEEVAKEFQKRRLEKDIYAAQVKARRMAHLQALAMQADEEMRQRRRRKTGND